MTDCKIGVDTGGTFTDFVMVKKGKLSVFKVPSTPDQPARAIASGLNQLGIHPPFLFIHGSTVATNAFLERKGGKVLLITTAGFEDVLEIGRQQRPELYALHVTREPPLVPSSYRLGIRERLSADGTILYELSQEDVKALQKAIRTLKPDAVAIVTLHAYVNDVHEKRVEAFLKPEGVPVFRSSRVFPEYREYERTLVTVLNAYLHPVVSDYLNELSHFVGERWRMMVSSGGSVPWRIALERPIETLLSGPVAGVVAARYLGKKLGFKKLLTIDIGGTSTDVSIIDEDVLITQETTLGGFPIPIPMVQIHTIGSGGGSILWHDPGGALRVGPRSAGADPGPACYARGGDQPTLTDAHLFLKQIHPEYFLDGSFPLNPDLAQIALEELARSVNLSPDELARGAVHIAETQMARALRVISLQQGYDTRDFALFAFGGAGGLYACNLAERLGISQVIWPAWAGVISAFGTLLADLKLTATRSLLIQPDKDGMDLAREVYRSLSGTLKEQLLNEFPTHPPSSITFQSLVSVRYKGQSYELIVPFSEDPEEVRQRFESLHFQRYGFTLKEVPLEYVTAIMHLLVPAEEVNLPVHEPASSTTSSVSWTGKGDDPALFLRLELPPGKEIKGPAIISDPTSTLWIPSSWKAVVHHEGHLIVSKL